MAESVSFLGAAGSLLWHLRAFRIHRAWAEQLGSVIAEAIPDYGSRETRIPGRGVQCIQSRSIRSSGKQRGLGIVRHSNGCRTASRSATRYKAQFLMKNMRTIAFLLLLCCASRPAASEPVDFATEVHPILVA